MAKSQQQQGEYSCEILEQDVMHAKRISEGLRAELVKLKDDYSAQLATSRSEVENLKKQIEYEAKTTAAMRAEAFNNRELLFLKQNEVDKCQANVMRLEEQLGQTKISIVTTATEFDMTQKMLVDTQIELRAKEMELSEAKRETEQLHEEKKSLHACIIDEKELTKSQGSEINELNEVVREMEREIRWVTFRYFILYVFTFVHNAWILSLLALYFVMFPFYKGCWCSTEQSQ